MKQPIVDLRRESECNGVENYVAIEAMEVGRQRAEAAQWTFQRIKNSLDNQQTSLSGNSVFKHTSRDIHVECSKQFKWNVGAERAVLGRAKTALTFKHEI